MWPFKRSSEQLEDAIREVDRLVESHDQYVERVFPNHLYRVEEPCMSIDFDIDEIQSDEIKAMNAIEACFNELDKHEVLRILRWVVDKYVADEDVQPLSSSLVARNIHKRSTTTTVPMTETRP